VVVVAAGAVVDGAVLGGSVGTTVETVVVGGSVKITPGLVTVVAGGGAAVVTTGGGVVRGGAVAVVVTAGAEVVVVEELSDVVGPPGALSPSMTTVDGGTGIRVCDGGRITLAAGVAGEVSRATAATRMPMTSAPTPTARRAFVRDAGSRASHQMRIRSSAGGRPNAGFLPMDDHER
jgi:xanthine/CO dehydrogenase XdhC/CoxF family maturation factor